MLDRFAIQPTAAEFLRLNAEDSRRQATRLDENAARLEAEASEHRVAAAMSRAYAERLDAAAARLEA